MKLALALFVIPLLVLFAACGQAGEPANSTPAESNAPADNGTVASAFTEDDFAAARQVVFDYWDACNCYDVDAALACLEDSHRQERAADIPGEIAQMEGAGVQLGAIEEAPPSVIDDEIVVITIKLDVPIMPDRHIVYHLIQVDGDWKICFSEEI
ncbi:MAG: hypothetical protein PVJ61_01335 [Dehalococcoidia bacterium]|jgi:hypothetical protein